MKKRFTIIFPGLFLLMMLIGCGNTSETNKQEAEKKIEKEIAAETQTEAEEQQAVESEEIETEDRVSWFDSHGLVITPQGEFSYTTMSVDIDNIDVGTFDVPSEVMITETTVGVEDGYKQVMAIFTEDVSASEESSYWNYVSAFDRYTGTSFEFDTEAIYTDSGDTVQKKGFVTISNGKESYDVSVRYDAVNDYPYIEDSITVICPIDYDGVVFQIGYCDPARLEEFMEIDLAERLYTIDEFPFYGEGYYYFSYSDK